MTEQKDFDYTRYFELKKQLEEASRLYYKEGVSPMSDQDFDFGLKEMEAQNPRAIHDRPYGYS